MLATAALGHSVFTSLDGNIRIDKAAVAALADERERVADTPGTNVLLLGADNRGQEISRGDARSDTIMLLHVADGGGRASVISLPRDLMVDIPRCKAVENRAGAPGGEQGQLNWAYHYGGAACTIRTVEQLTKVRVDHHLNVDFDGFKNVVDAVGGVPVKLDKPLHDRRAQLSVPAGEQVLNGAQALGYMRTRKSFADGSDSSRIRRQQAFLKKAAEEVRESGTLTRPDKLYGVLDAGTQALTADPGLGSLEDLYDLLRKVRAVPDDEFTFRTVPVRPHPADRNRLALREPAAGRLFERLRKDEG
ncbi:LCP family protein [Streptomyces boninensis]|uniref:LCP family protein n=1 Tax=Streptomyces boninensis TaxID=2039455 RepID=UPI003B223991